MALVEVLRLACGVLPGYRPAERRVLIPVVGAEEPLRVEVEARHVRTEEPPGNGKPVSGELSVLLWAYHGDTVTVVLPLLRGEGSGLATVPRLLVTRADELRV